MPDSDFWTGGTPHQPYRRLDLPYNLLVLDFSLLDFLIRPYIVPHETVHLILLCAQRVSSLKGYRVPIYYSSFLKYNSTFDCPFTLFVLFAESPFFGTVRYLPFLLFQLFKTVPLKPVLLIYLFSSQRVSSFVQYLP